MYIVKNTVTKSGLEVERYQIQFNYKPLKLTWFYDKRHESNVRVRESLIRGEGVDISRDLHNLTPKHALNTPTFYFSYVRQEFQGTMCQKHINASLIFTYVNDVITSQLFTSEATD